MKTKNTNSPCMTSSLAKNKSIASGPHSPDPKRSPLALLQQHLGDMPYLTPYIRYSSNEQGKGRSEHRQLAGQMFAREYAAMNGYRFDETTPMIDRGRSGFTGENRKKGALGNYLKLVQSGRIPRGSILYVENIDRLSREGTHRVLQDILFKLFDADIRLLVRFPEVQLYTKENFDEVIDIFIAETKRAKGESKRRSELLRDAWLAKKQLAVEQGVIPTNRCPAWLQVVTKIGKTAYSVCPGAQHTIALIFQLYAQGVGLKQLEKRLNSDAQWMPPSGNGWRGSYIHKILGNRAVLGEYQPHKLKDGRRVKEEIGVRANLYPKIVSADMFEAAELRLSKNKGKGGRTGKAWNVLKHLVKCPYCGGTMALLDKGALPKGGRYLVCESGRRNHKCGRRSVSYSEVEQLVLNNCIRLQPERVLPENSENTRICRELHTKIDAAQNAINRNSLRISKLTLDRADETEEEVRAVAFAAMNALAVQNRELGSELDRAAEELRRRESTAQSVENWQRSLAGLKGAIAAESGAEARMLLNAHLSELIDRIELFTDGFGRRFNPDTDHTTRRKCGAKQSGGAPQLHCREARTHAPESDDFADWLEALVSESDQTVVKTDTFHAFVEAVMRRRMSKEGRFVRIHFKSGSYLDVAPVNSLAFRWERVAGSAKGFRFVSPSLDALLADFISKRSAKTVQILKCAS